MDLKRILWVAVTFILAGAPTAQSATIWVEGEKPAANTMNRHPWWYDKVKRNQLSAGDWISNFSKEKEGTADYRFTVPARGKYAFWVRANPIGTKLSYRLRPKDKWRLIDMSKAKQRVNIAEDGKPDLRFIAWVWVGDISLEKGPAAVSFRMHSDNSNHGALDAFVLSTKNFAPQGANRPGVKSAPAGTWPTKTTWAFKPSDDKFTDKTMLDVWNLARAHRESTATREHICINGLWRSQPARDQTGGVPSGKWGYFKVPGSWPGITNYMQKDSQTVHAHPSWKNQSLRGITSMWYQREITIPASWTGRRITVHAEYLNSFAAVYVDGRKAGEMRFPAGEVDITSLCTVGKTHVLSLAVDAMPLKGVMLSYKDTTSARKVKGSVARRGLCGDVYLVGAPKGPRISDVKIDTSVRKGQITLGVAADGLAADTQYVLAAQLTDGGRRVGEFASKAFTLGDLKSGRIAFTSKWKPEKLWDIHTPDHKYTAALSLLDANKKLIDAALPVRFGFREFWINGRDFHLNGSRIHLSAVPLDWATSGQKNRFAQRDQNSGYVPIINTGMPVPSAAPGENRIIENQMKLLLSRSSRGSLRRMPMYSSTGARSMYAVTSVAMGICEYVISSIHTQRGNTGVSITGKSIQNPIYSSQ
jgi:hypothetical protein